MTCSVSIMFSLLLFYLIIRYRGKHQVFLRFNKLTINVI